MNERTLQERKSFLANVEARFTSGDTQAILEMAQERLQWAPGDWDALSAICRVRIQQGKLDEALEMLKELEEPLDGLSRIYASLGSLCLKREMEEEARIFFQKYRVLNPASPVTAEMAARLGDGGAMPEAGAEPETANAGTEEGPSDIPDDFQTVTLAELYIRQGHLTQAVEVLEAILQRDPQHVKAAEKLRELRGEIPGKGDAGEQVSVVAELSRWLEQIDRLRAHAA